MAAAKTTTLPKARRDRRTRVSQFVIVVGTRQPGASGSGERIRRVGGTLQELPFG
jgi:hypothetical protein